VEPRPAQENVFLSGGELLLSARCRSVAQISLCRTQNCILRSGDKAGRDRRPGLCRLQVGEYSRVKLCATPSTGGRRLARGSEPGEGERWFPPPGVGFSLDLRWLAFRRRSGPRAPETGERKPPRSISRLETPRHIFPRPAGVARGQRTRAASSSRAGFITGLPLPGNARARQPVRSVRDQQDGRARSSASIVNRSVDESTSFTVPGTESGCGSGAGSGRVSRMTSSRGSKAALVSAERIWSRSRRTRHC